jgi:Uncharacterised protein family UPF0547
MAAGGQVFNQQVVVTEKPEALMQRFVSATAGTSGYSINTAGPNSLVLTRKYTPTSAIVGGIILGLLTLIGFALLLLKKTESLTITLSGAPEGTRVSISGVATPEIIARLYGVLSAVTVATTGEVVEAAGEVAGATEADTKTCPRCAETIKAQALVCRFCGYEFEQESLTEESAS